MQSLPEDYRAVVIGSSGGIGSAFLSLLEADKRCGEVVGLSRGSAPGIDLTDETTIAEAAKGIGGPVNLIVDATGFLSDEETKPEKTLRHLNAENLRKLFDLNSIGPALVMKHFLPLLPKEERGVFATLSARVGSIGDNRLGGWYAYRASKAALNMLVKSAAIETTRTRPLSVLAALHPGTVATRLSDPFAGSRERLEPETSAAMMLEVLDGLGSEESGCFRDYRGDHIEW